LPGRSSIDGAKTGGFLAKASLTKGDRQELITGIIWAVIVFLPECQIGTGHFSRDNNDLRRKVQNGRKEKERI
jgi:hypothetical protein